MSPRLTLTDVENFTVPQEGPKYVPLLASALSCSVVSSYNLLAVEHRKAMSPAVLHMEVKPAEPIRAELWHDECERRASSLDCWLFIHLTCRFSMADEYFNPSVFSTQSSQSFLTAILAAARSETYVLESHVAIVMSHIAAEGFFSELATFLQDLENENAHLKAAGHILGQLEVSRVQLPEKVKIAHQLFFGSQIDAGAEPYQSFALLVKLRNEIVHQKRQKAPKWFDYFVRNDLILSPASPDVITLHWNGQFRNSRCAKWACRAARGIISHFLTQLGDHHWSIKCLAIGWRELLEDSRIESD